MVCCFAVVGGGFGVVFVFGFLGGYWGFYSLKSSN